MAKVLQQLEKRWLYSFKMSQQLWLIMTNRYWVIDNESSMVKMRLEFQRWCLYVYMYKYKEIIAQLAPESKIEVSERKNKISWL